MPSINFDDYQKSQNPTDENTRKISVGSMDVTDTQYIIKEDNILLDFIEYGFGSEGEIEVWMSYIGGDFKTKVATLSQEEYNNIVLSEFLGNILNNELPCLECKSKFIDAICEMHHGEDEIIFEEGEGDEPEDNEKA